MTASTSKTDKFSEAVCAFSNDLPNHGEPGYLVIGVDDPGRFSGLTVTDELLRNLGPSLRDWRRSWADLRGKSPDPQLSLPFGSIETLGYVVMQHGIRDNQPPKAYERWIERFPRTYREYVLDTPSGQSAPSARDDEYNLAMLKHYRSLMPMAMEAHKPVFALKPAEGAIGAHGEAVRRAYSDFEALAERIMNRASNQSSL